jgi:hypothetical protein
MPGPMPLALDYNESPFPGTTEPWVDPSAITVPSGSTVDPAAVAAAATQILYLLSGRRYGVRQGTVRPHRMVQEFLTLGEMPVPTGWPFGVGITGAPMYRMDERTIVLDAPAVVSAVKIDGLTLVAGQDWELYDGRLLVRMVSQGGASIGWPLDQRLDLPDTAQGTWSITYQSGTPVPPGGKLAAKALADDLMRLLTPGVACALPDRAMTVSRQGVTINVGTFKELLDAGRTGIYAVDLWLGAVNPNGRRRRPRIAGPESVEEAWPS